MKISMKNLYQQCMLQKDNHIMICWLEAKNLRPGIKVTLMDSEDPKDWWQIAQVYNIQLPRSEIKDAHSSMKWHDKDHHRKLEGIVIKQEL